MRARSQTRIPDRRGVATLWVIITVLLGAIMFCIAIEVGNLWLARTQLQTSLEAAALASVRQWAEAGANGNATLGPRNRGVTLAAANRVGGVSMSISNNHSNAATNGNNSTSGELVFGALTGTSPNVFDPNGDAGCDLGDPAPVVRAEATATVPAFCTGLLGFGSYDVTASTYALYDCSSREPRLLLID